MAKLPMGKIADGAKKLAESLTSGSNATKIQSLKSAIDALTYDEKIKTFILFSGVIFNMAMVETDGNYTFSGEFLNGLNPRIVILSTSGKYVIGEISSNSTVSYTDASSSLSNGYKMELYLQQY